MIALILALVTVLLGVAPLFLAKRTTAGSVLGVIGFLGLWFGYYSGMPSFVWPLGGVVGGAIVVLWIIGAVVELIKNNNSYYGNREKIKLLPIAFAVLGVAGFLGYTTLSSWGAFRANDYARLIGDVEKREWTQDVQPKDPRHVRLVPEELAFYLATKQLGEAAGAIGSQFEVSKEHLTLQMIKGELWYVAPLDFKSFSAWQTARVSPGYVMVHGEDPKHPVVVKTGERFAFMPGAYFGGNLERHIWKDNLATGFEDYSFEVDDQGKAWWVVTTFKPTIGFEGKAVTGVIIIDPATGDKVTYPKDKVPAFAERVTPRQYVENYVDMNGKYRGGWFNSWWGHKDLVEGERPTLTYGSDGNPYWVSDITSVNANDSSLVGLMYVNSRTGKATLYHAVGGTDKAVLQLVDNKVSFRKLHGADPVLYNLYGVMTSIVPLLGESHSPQGVAFVDVANMQIAVGDDVESTIRQYQRLITTSGQQVAPERERQAKELAGTVDRFAPEVRGSETMYYFHLDGFPHIISGSGDISPKLRLTKVGDQVKIRFIESGEDTVPLLGFDNESLPLQATRLQIETRERVAERQATVATNRNVKTVRGELGNMPETELQELIKLRDQKKKP